MGKKELLSSAPWRGEETSNKFEDAKLRATHHPGATLTMHVRRNNKAVSSRAAAATDDDDDLETEIEQELRYSFQRNFQFLQ